MEFSKFIYNIVLFIYNKNATIYCITTYNKVNIYGQFLEFLFFYKG